ncbi:MAG: translation initiation factor IF-3 [Clostridiales bacterium]|nr:translation initiation factor IF-3 [Clostridiales bacterium]
MFACRYLSVSGIAHAFLIHHTLLSRNLWRCSIISNKDLRINDQIRDKEVRVIGDDGTQLGILPLSKALDIAAERNLDLVKVAPQAKPPVCRIMDYGKYRFEQAKREKEARKNQKTIEVKEVRMSLNIDTHDFNTKLGHALKFLKSGDKVKVSVRFRRAREMSHSNLAYDLLDRFKDGCEEHGQIDKPPKLEGRNVTMFISPKVSK